MIRLFLKDLPYNLTQLMVREYEAKCRELSQWVEHSRYPRIKNFLNNRDEIEFIFALGIYYRYIIAPLNGSTEFFNRLDRSYQAGLKFGGRDMNREYMASIEKASKYFSMIAKEFNLTESLLLETGVRKSIFSLLEMEERRSRE